MCARAVPVPQIGRSGVVHRDISREADRSSLASRVGTRGAGFFSAPWLWCLLILVVGWLSGISWVGAEETADTSDDVPSQAEPATRDEDSDDTADVDTESTVDTAEDKRGFKVAGDLRPIIDYFDVDVNFFLMQYFVNYNFPSGWYLTSAPIITSNWEADSGEKWTVPFGGGVGKVFSIGRQPMNINTQVFYNVETPTNGARWQWRFQIQLLFPK